MSGHELRPDGERRRRSVAYALMAGGSVVYLAAAVLDLDWAAATLQALGWLAGAAGVGVYVYGHVVDADG